jgi:hypothetical protein
MSKYLIGGGYYSDWYTVGYADDEETAKKIVYQKNLNSNGTIGDEYWYKKLDKIEVVGDIDTSGVYIKYSYVEYHSGDKVTDMLDWNNELYGDNIKTEPMIDEFHSDSFNRGKNWCVSVTFTVRFDTDKDKVLKIGRDKLAMYKAEKMGLI